MFNNSIKTAAIFCGCLLLLQGCQALHQSEQLIALPPPHVPPTKDIVSVPFYPQEDFYCGPTTLAEVFNYYGRQLTPEIIAPNVFIPDREGSLQIEMVATTRNYDFVPYATRSDLETIINLVSESRPVIVFQNLALSWLPMWHYALVKGYDLTTSEFILHTGVTENYRVGFKLFERTWQRADYWLLVPFPAGETSQYLEPYTFIKASYDLLSIGKVDTAIASLIAASKQWPYEWLSFFLLGNHFLDQAPQQAVSWYKQGYKSGKLDSNYLNNYAYALSLIGCNREAMAVISEALLLAPDDLNLKETAREINSDRTEVSKQSCEL